MTTFVKKNIPVQLVFSLIHISMAALLTGLIQPYWLEQSSHICLAAPIIFHWRQNVDRFTTKMLTGSPQQRGVQLDHRLPTTLLPRTFSTHALVIRIETHQTHLNFKINTATQIITPEWSKTRFYLLEALFSSSGPLWPPLKYKFKLKPGFTWKYSRKVIEKDKNHHHHANTSPKWTPI